MTAVGIENPYLQGLLAPVMDERDDRDLEVVGRLPEGLRGVFVRNGPNPQFSPLGGYHPFDGDGMLHAVYFEDGAVRYRNRFVESKGLVAERRRGRACYGGLGEFRPPEDGVGEEAGMVKNVANTHFVRHAHRYLALLEVAPPTEMTRELETLGEYDFGGRLAGGMTAHPKIDTATGEMHFFGYSPFPPYLRYHVVDAEGTLVHSTEIDLPGPVMMHDFAITQNHVVFLDSPAVFDVEALLRGGAAVRWDPDTGTRIGVMPRMGDGDQIRWLEIDNCYVVHFFNAWERDGSIEILGPRMERMPGGFEFHDPQGSPDPLPWRWSIDLTAGSVSARQIDDRAGEFPRINDEFAGREQRFGYIGRQRRWDFDFSFHGVIKHDFETGESHSHFYDETVTCGEHVFAADPAGSAEDDGWLLTLVTDGTTGDSELVVLDARDLETGPIARVPMKRRVPIGFHANWFPET